MAVLEQTLPNLSSSKMHEIEKLSKEIFKVAMMSEELLKARIMFINGRI